MDYETEIQVTTRSNAAGGKFQADLEPSHIFGIGRFANWWSERSSAKPFEIERAIKLIEAGIVAALKEGIQLNLGLAIFYPRLSGALSSRDSDPKDEGLFVRGAVKARTELTHALEKSLKPVNSLSRTRSNLHQVKDVNTEELNTIKAGHVYHGVGTSIPIVAGREDEGVWLEKKKKRDMVKRARARILESTDYGVDFVFDYTPARGRYSLVVQTRGGLSQDFKPVRAHCLVDVK